MNASQAVEGHADCLEKACLENPMRFLAWTDVIRDLRLTASEDEAVATYGESAEEMSDIEVATYGESAEEMSGIEPFETILERWTEVLTHRT